MSDAMDALAMALGSQAAVLALSPEEAEEHLNTLRQAARELLESLAEATVDALRGANGQPQLTETEALVTTADVTRKRAEPLWMSLIIGEAVMILAKRRMGADGA